MRYSIYIWITLVTVVVVVGLAVGALIYSSNMNEINSQLESVEYKIKELPSLEEDIFTKCMSKLDGTAQNIAFCQENTQEQIHTLSQDLQSTKQDLENKSIVEVIRL